MKNISLALLTTALLVGCGGDPSPQEPQKIQRSMEVSVDLSEEHRCSRISPEIEVPTPPHGTVSLLVNLEDVDDANRNHGGGSWTVDTDLEDGILIQQGALTRYYRGPCPPSGESRTYQYVVKALDVNKQLLGVGTYTFLQD